MKRFAKSMAVTATGLLVVTASLTACSSGNEGTGFGSDQINDPGSQATCMTEMSADQQRELEAYVKSNGDEFKQTGDDGTVCVIDNQGNMRMYNQHDGFSQYLLYSMLLGRSNSLAMYGVLSGDLSAGDAIILSMLTNVGNDGRMYHPYTQSGDSWNRTPNYTGKNVMNVYYGKDKTGVSFNTAKSQSSTKYKMRSYPKATSQMGSFSKNGNGKSTMNSKPLTPSHQNTRQSTNRSGSTHYSTNKSTMTNRTKSYSTRSRSGRH